MSLSVNTNLSALDANRNLNQTSKSLALAEQRLSSGLRVNSAAEDVAGYAISQSLMSQVNGLNQATENSQDAVALAQTAQGSLNDVVQMLQRVRELGVQYANGTTSEEGKKSIEGEVTQLKEEIERVAKTTTFNGTKLLEGEAGIAFQVGANDKETIEVKAFGLVAAIGTKISVTGEKALEELTKAISEVTTAAGKFGAVQDRVQYAQSNTEVYAQNLQSAASGITDVNMAAEMTNFTKLQVLQQAGVSILAQANAEPQAVLKLLQ